jgi:ParB-like chromosome segregation protein Spo0J
MKEREYEFHPFANAFPMMSDQEHAELVADIDAHGQREPIMLYDDDPCADGCDYLPKILDGRNRYRACLELGIKPLYEHFEGDDAAVLAFVISKNLVRRHLTTSQRAMIAADLATLQHGQRKARSDTSNDVSQAEAAKLVHVSLPTVQRASKVKQQGTPELAASVRRGEITVSAAAAEIDAQGRGDGVGNPDEADADADHPLISEDHPVEADADKAAVAQPASKQTARKTKETKASEGLISVLVNLCAICSAIGTDSVTSQDFVVAVTKLHGDNFNDETKTLHRLGAFVTSVAKGLDARKTGAAMKTNARAKATLKPKIKPKSKIKARRGGYS